MKRLTDLKKDPYVFGRRGAAWRSVRIQPCKGTYDGLSRTHLTNSASNCIVTPYCVVEGHVEALIVRQVLDAALRMSRVLTTGCACSAWVETLSLDRVQDFHLISSCGAMGSNLQMVAEDEKRPVHLAQKFCEASRAKGA